jgi:hypothetical protein
LLALVVIAVWEEHEAAKATVGSEANELAEVFWLAHRFPEPEGHQLQELARSYARVVVEEEWSLMKRGRSTPRTWALLDEMRFSVQDLGIRTPADQVLFEQGLDRAQGWRTPGGFAWWRPKTAYPPSCRPSWGSGGSSRWASRTCSDWRTRGRTG